MQSWNQKICLPLAAILWVGVFAPDLQADEDFESAFRSSGLPWYDSDSDSLKPSSAPGRPASSVSNRNRIPPLQVKPRGQQVVKPVAAPVATTGGGGGTMGTIGTSIIYVVGAILALILIGLLVYGFLKLEADDAGTEADSKKKKRKIRDHVKHLPFEIEEEDGDFESFADKAFREGDYSKAVIYLFADVLVAMSEAGLVRLQRGKTNRQYLNEVWDYGEVRPYYRKVMTAFEDAFFGKHEIERSRAEECFVERPAFDAAVEKIRLQKFAATQSAPMIPMPEARMEGIS